MASKSDNTLLWVLLGVGVVAVVGVGGYVVMKGGIGTKQLRGPTDAQAAALIAKAQSDAAIQQAKSAEKIAESQHQEWWQTALIGVGEGAGKFLGSAGSFF